LESLEDLTLRLKSVFETAVDGIIIINDKGIIQDINESGSKIFGYAIAELRGVTINTLMPTQYSKNHDQYLHSFKKTRIPKIIGIGREVIGLKKDGTQFPFWLSVSEVVLHDKTLFTGFVHDLTRVKAAEEKLNQLNSNLEKTVVQRTYELERVVNQLLALNSKLEDEVAARKFTEDQLRIRELELKESLAKEKELGELKSRFVSMASHEFRTPLATIQSSAGLIGRYTESDQQENRVKHIDKIKSSVVHLTNILNDFLSISKLEEGKTVARIEHFEVVHFIEETIDEMKHNLKNNNIFKINKEITELDINCDQGILKNIFFNLVSNAIKYAKPNTAIEIGVQKSEEYFSFYVKDEGIGIPIDDQKYLFERFFRASNSVNIEGTGLGLHIVKKYIELIQGKILFESEEQIGTKFTVEIPINPPK